MDRVFTVVFNPFHTLMEIPIWLPWIFVGGTLFILLSFLAAKYRDKKYSAISSVQDFISGAILTSFTGILMPDLFPILSHTLPSLSLPLTMMSGGTLDDVQVGPPPLSSAFQNK